MTLPTCVQLKKTTNVPMPIPGPISAFSPGSVEVFIIK